MELVHPDDREATLAQAQKLTEGGEVRAGEKGLELACRIAPDVPDTLLGDPGRLRQVVVNLVGNAIKFTERGEVVLEAQLGAADDRGVSLHVAVRDTGIGIEPDKQQHIFGAFAQADSSTTRRYGGTGLGLAISAQLVEMMGGRLSLESTPGRGSTFAFTADFGRPAGAPSERRPAGALDLRGLRVLIVDDSATNRRIVEEMLASWHMHAAAAADAAAAMAVLEQAWEAGAPMDLVVLDGQMPNVDGFTVARRLRRDNRFKATPIVMLTSMGHSADVRRCRDIGVSAHLTKPVKHSDLLDAIATLVAARGPREKPRVERARAAKRLRILLAEDNAVNRRLASSILRKRGHQVVTAETGRQAVRAAARRPTGRSFDIVLMDVQMPEMSGLEATAAIRERERRSGTHVPIVAMTAHALPADRERCLQAGMDGYLAKPIHADELVAAVERFGGGTSAPAHDVQVFDQAAALRIAGGDRRLLGDVARLFLEDWPGRARALRRAVAAGDAGAVRAIAHAIKGAVAALGAGAARDAALALETMARAPAPDGLDALRAALEQRVDELVRTLRAGRLLPPRRAARRPAAVTRRRPATGRRRA
jgi:CheY-like chemotaxis protein